MKAKRRRHDSQFKAKVALEALKGVKTIQQIAKDYDVCRRAVKVHHLWAELMV